ncbi:glycoside hydrolase domain-containing protein (plasmid) [Paraburkholderia sp. DD10]|uniref:glycoside hydrolase domain-containing protein n=1 Tax=Paraburkholderia sp. DD10 TaxID=3409691 RepID=UPI003B9FF33A
MRRFGDKASNFDRSCGVEDGRYARTYGAAEIGQPGRAAIYFGIDFDASRDEIRTRIIPYFQGVADAFAVQTGEPQYLVGVYGSGATCDAVLNAGLARLAWLAQSTGWSGHAAFLNSHRWALNQLMPSTIAGVACDPDTAGDDISIGDFLLAQAPAPLGAHAAANRAALMPMFVNARGGLHLRSGPGVEFNVTRLLALGMAVHPLKSVGSWMSVDLQGDDVADGFVSGAYLTDKAPSSAAGQAEATPASHYVSADAIHVPELIRQGSTEDGLRTARETAKASLPGYPHNGCAAHLSALLEQAGIDIPMTWGAGKLAHVLADRGWSKVGVGSQRAGDVGVCFDNTSPPGADHIYLVIAASGPDEMMIADNQRTADAVHERFASGHGKTATEYFLRAPETRLP